VHRNAPLTTEGRLWLCHRIEDGWTVTAAAESMNISRQCAHKWWRRYRDEGLAGLEDRSSRPHRSPNRTPARMERRIVALRVSRRLGPDPAFLVAAWARVRANKGARTAGVDGVAPRSVVSGAAGLLGGLRDDLKAGRFVPQRVREKTIPKAGGKVRALVSRVKNVAQIRGLRV
jgi:transposase-like protein